MNGNTRTWFTLASPSDRGETVMFTNHGKQRVVIAVLLGLGVIGIELGI